MRTLLAAIGPPARLRHARPRRRAGLRHAQRRHARRLRDLGGGRPLGRQHERLLVARRRARLTRILGHGDRRGDPRLPPLEVGAGLHRRRRDRRQLRLLGREDLDRRDRIGRRLQARHRLLLRQLRPPGPGADAAELREDPQRARGRRDDRRQQLRLRRDRRALRDELDHVALVAEELLQRRLRHDLALHRRAPGAGDDQRPRRAAAGARRDDHRRLHAPRSTRSSPRPTGRRSRAAAASATRRPAGRASRSAAAAPGTATPTGPTTPSSTR